MVQSGLVAALTRPDSAMHACFKILQCETLDDEVLLRHMCRVEATVFAISVDPVKVYGGVLLRLFFG
jgi:hypothetical protein